MLVTIRFSSVEEFLEELDARPPNVDGLVRVTKRYESRDGTPLASVAVVASYLRAPTIPAREPAYPGQGFPGHEHLMTMPQLLGRVGDVYRGGPPRYSQSEDVERRAEEGIARLQAAIAERGLSCGGGLPLAELAKG